MNRLNAFVILALAMADVGCGEKQDRVVATFVFPPYTTTRIVLYTSGKYEQWMLGDGVPNFPYNRSWMYRITLRGVEARERKPPIEMGTYLRSATNINISLKPDPRQPPDYPAQRVFRIIIHDGLEYLFDERGGWALRYEETNDTNLLRYAWRRERR
jgi:hypothetical protein